jgi:UPF0271 protein
MSVTVSQTEALPPPGPKLSGQQPAPAAQAASIDLNCDLGEGFGVWQLADDLALLDIVSSANVACGFHAGDPVIMRRVCDAAAERGVTIGAHVGYRDLAGFGRRNLDIAPDELCAEVLYQLGALDGMARAAGSAVRYLKPHGALYNATVADRLKAAAVVAAVTAFDPSLAVVGLPGSALLKHAASAGLTTIREGFADRAYTARATLVPRTTAGAVVHDPAEVARRSVQMATGGGVESEDGCWLAMPIDSLCLHSDTLNALELARLIRHQLVSAGVTIEPFIAARPATALTEGQGFRHVSDS